MYLRQSWSTVSIPRPRRSIFTSPAASRSSFSHWMTVRSSIEAGSVGAVGGGGAPGGAEAAPGGAHGGGLDGDDGAERLLGEDEAADVDAAVTRGFVQSGDDVGEALHAEVGRIEAGARKERCGGQGAGSGCGGSAGRGPCTPCGICCLRRFFPRRPRLLPL